MNATTFAVTLSLLLGSLASQQAIDVKIPRPPVIGPDVKTVAPRLQKPAAPRVVGEVPPAMPFAARAKRSAAADGWDTLARLAGPDFVAFDRPGSDVLWAATHKYKARFCDRGFEFTPFLGSDAPDNYPVSFRLDRVTLGGEAMPLLGAGPRLDGRRVSFVRGPVVECYDVRADAVEQLFRFDALPVRDELVVTMNVVARGLNFESTDTGFRFVNDRGGVTYSRAVAVDGKGRRLSLATRWHAGRIHIEVPAGFVRSATLPLTIDPVVRTMNLHAENYSLYLPDVTVDMSAGRYMYVWNKIFSGTDTDVWFTETDLSGNPYGGLVPVDTTSDSWEYAKIANNAQASRNLVVAQVSTNGASPFRVMGRMCEPGGVRGAPFVIADASVTGHARGDKMAPDVGGDFNQQGPTYFTVVWSRVDSPTDWDIHMKQVTRDRDPQLRSAIPTAIAVTSENEWLPVISDSCGAPPSSSQRFVIVYHRTYAPLDEDIYYALTTWDGQIARPASPLDISSASDLSPSVSAPTADPHGGPRYWMATYQRILTTTNWDICASVGDITGSRLIVGENLTLLEPLNPTLPHTSWLQGSSSVATDGCRFAVAYNEAFMNTLDIDVRVTTFFYHPVAMALGVSESRASLASLAPYAETNPEICSQFSSGGPALRYAAVWQDDRGAVQDAIVAGLYHGMGAGGITVLPNGCIPLPITWNGVPAMGAEMTIDASGGFGLLFGIPRAVPFQCGPCQILIDGDTYVPSVTFIIPHNPNLLGGIFLAQGFDVAPGLPCMNAVGLSDTLEFAVR